MEDKRGEFDERIGDGLGFFVFNVGKKRES